MRAILLRVRDWLKPKLWLGYENDQDLFGWYNAVYLRVGPVVLHVGASVTK